MLASSAMDASPHEASDRASSAGADEMSVIQALTGPERDICSSPADGLLPGAADPLPADATDEAVALAEACRILQFIQVARDVLPALRDLADHPGWEIALHIFIAGREGRAITTADLCERTGTWRPLAVRYIEMFHERGLIHRDEDGAQKPDNWALSLVPSAAARLQALLCSFSRGFRARSEAAAPN